MKKIEIIQKMAYERNKRVEYVVECSALKAENQETTDLLKPTETTEGIETCEAIETSHSLEKQSFNFDTLSEAQAFADKCLEEKRFRRIDLFKECHSKRLLSSSSR